MDHQLEVKVTLTALNSNIVPSERVLKLNPDNPTVQIGRASKSLSKGLLGGPSNGWVNSPVMSRNHAEISLTSDNTVVLKDIGSMHGTYLNNSQLQPKEPEPVADGDTVIFGTEVKRGLESFPACAFRISYGFFPWKATKANTFTFPNSSDAEDEDDYSDEEMYGVEEDIEEHSSEDDVSVKSIPSRTSVAIEPIDLTRDESEINEVFTLDSIHEASSDGRRGGLIAGQHVDVGIASEICNLPSAGIDNPVILDNTDGEEDDPISDADSLSDAGDSEIHGSDFYGSESGSEHENDNEEHIVGVGGEAVIFSLSQQVQQMSDARIFPHVKDQSVKEASPRSVLHTYIEPSQNKMKEDDNDNDDESNFSLSDASAEGIRALFGEDLFGNGGQNQYFNDRDDDAESLVACQSISKSSQQTESLEPPRHVTFASPSSDTTADIASSFSRYHTIDDSISTLSTAQTMQATQALAQGLSVHRLPSPSDAAMVKTATLITTVPRETANPVKVHHLPSRDWRLLTAHSLGDKTGKHAFFEAREGNRARFYAGENDWPKESSITSQPIDATLEQLQVRRKPQSLTAIKSLGQKVEKDLEIVGTATGGCSLSKPASSSPGFANPLVTPSSFLGARTLSPTMDSNASPEAVIETTMKYNESKSSTVFSKNLNQSAPLQPVRSGLSIDDIIERSSADQSQNLKRKSEGISDVLEKEERAWERPSNLDGSNSSAENPTVDSNLSSSLVESIEVTDKLVLELPDHRPSKRLKKFVEAVSYAALGGAAVGAGLFSVLVATAPEFL